MKWDFKPPRVGVVELEQGKEAAGELLHQCALLWLGHHPPNTHPEPEPVPGLELHFQDDRGNVISKEGEGLALVQRYPAAKTCTATHCHHSLPATTLARWAADSLAMLPQLSKKSHQSIEKNNL